MSQSLVKDWFGIFLEKRLLIIGLFGFSSGIPYFLTASTLAIWLKSLDFDYETIGYFAIASIPYSLRFLWAPFIDRTPIPCLTKMLGRRRAWMLLSQIGLILSLGSFFFMAPTIEMAIVTTFFAATQETVMLTYQMETLNKSQYGPGDAIGIMGARLGMLVGGAGALYLSQYISWETVYLTMALFIFVGITTTLYIEEPKPVVNPETLLQEEKIKEYLLARPKIPIRLSLLLSWLYAAILCPFKEFTSRSGWLAALGIMFFYKFGDNLIGTMPNMMYLELGYSKSDIADATKLFGMLTSIIGGLFGGVLVSRIGFYKSLLYFCFFHMLATIMYIVTYKYGNNVEVLYFSVALEHFTAGMRTAALFAFQLTLSNPVYAATQLALLTSVVYSGRTLFPSLSGILVMKLGWVQFYNLAIFASIPALLICLYLMKTNNEFVWRRNALQIS